VLGVQVLGAVILVTLYTTGQGQAAARPLAVALGMSAVAAWVAACWLHTVEGDTRRVKFGLLLSGQSLLSWALLLYVHRAHVAAPAHVALVAAVGVLALPQAWLIHRFVRPDSPVEEKPRAFQRALRLYRVGMWAGSSLGWRSGLAVLLARVIDPTGYGFFLVRYFATEKLLGSKVIYLRAFREPQSEALASRVVAPLTRSVPVEAWAHDQPGDGAFARSGGSAMRVQRLRVEDSNWQLWLEHALARSLAVIVDASAEGTNASYELKLALQLVPRERIVVLLPEGMREPRSGLSSITYDASAPEQAARPLAEWLARVVEAFPRELSGRA
jgi:hypothetical protein